MSGSMLEKNCCISCRNCSMVEKAFHLLVSMMSRRRYCNFTYNLGVLLVLSKLGNLLPDAKTSMIHTWLLGIYATVLVKWTLTFWSKGFIYFNSTLIRSSTINFQFQCSTIKLTYFHTSSYYIAFKWSNTSTDYHKRKRNKVKVYYQLIKVRISRQWRCY